MVYRVRGGKAYVFQALTSSGSYRQLGTGMKDRSVAKDVEHMWGKLAQKRAWDLLQPVLNAAGRARTKLLVQLYDLWVKADGNIETVRQLKKDRDIEPLVEEWLKHYRGEVAETSADDAETYVRWLLPKGEPRLISEVTPAWLTERLTAYGGKRSTRRAVHAKWSKFFEYATTVHQYWTATPMANVPRPTLEVTPIRFYEQDVVERIVAWQPTAKRRALFALIYGAATELSIVPRLTRRDFFDVQERVIRASGTKNHTRDRVARIADWAWPIVWEYVKDFLPDAKPWGDCNRYTISDWHRQTVGWDEGRQTGLNLPHGYTAHNARDHWAVMRMRAGAPAQLVADQLGHGDANLVHKKYGRFRPNTLDRALMEERVAAYEARRLAAQ